MSTVLTEILIDEAGRVANDVPCQHCQYNLRMQASDGNCPECQSPISASIHGYYLIDSDLEWLKSVRRGLWRLCELPAFVLVLVVFFWLLQMKGPGSLGADLTMFAGFIGVVLLFQGIKGVSTVEPNRPDAMRWTARRWLRQSGWITMLLIFSFLVIGIAIAPLPSHVRILVLLVELLVDLIRFVLVIILMSIPLTLLSWLAVVAQRSPAESLKRFIRIVWRFTAVLFGLLLCLYLMSLVLFYNGVVGRYVQPYKPIRVQLNPAQRVRLASGDDVFARLVDPNDPNGLYEIDDSGGKFDPNSNPLAQRVQIRLDPNDPNRVITTLPLVGGARAGGVIGWPFGGYKGLAILSLLVLVMIWITLIPSYRNVNRVVKVLEARQTPPTVTVQ